MLGTTIAGSVGKGLEREEVTRRVNPGACRAGDALQAGSAGRQADRVNGNGTVPHKRNGRWATASLRCYQRATPLLQCYSIYTHSLCYCNTLMQ